MSINYTAYIISINQRTDDRSQDPVTRVSYRHAIGYQLGDYGMDIWGSICKIIDTPRLFLGVGGCKEMSQR